MLKRDWNEEPELSAVLAKAISEHRDDLHPFVWEEEGGSFVVHFQGRRFVLELWETN